MGTRRKSTRSKGTRKNRTNRRMKIKGGAALANNGSGGGSALANNGSGGGSALASYDARASTHVVPSDVKLSGIGPESPAMRSERVHNAEKGSAQLRSAAAEGPEKFKEVMNIHNKSFLKKLTDEKLHPDYDKKHSQEYKRVHSERIKNITKLIEIYERTGNIEGSDRLFTYYTRPPMNSVLGKRAISVSENS